MDATSVHVETASRSRHIAHLAILLVVAPVAIACSNASDTLRPPTADTTSRVAPVPPPFAPPSRAAIIYNEAGQLYDNCTSRFVLFDNSTFQLEQSCTTRGLRISGGHYARADSMIAFELYYSSASVTTRVHARVTGDTISVYSVYGNAWDDDFIGGTFVRQR